MSEVVRAVLWKDWREVRAQGYLRYGFVGLVGLWLVNMAFVSRGIIGFFGRQAVEMMINNVMSHQLLTIYAMVVFMMVQTVYSKERQTGSLEMLLAAPVSVYEIWLGKTLVLFLGSLATAVITAVAVVVELNIMYYSDFGIILPNPASLIFFLVVGPMISFAMCGILGLLNFNTRLYTVGTLVYMFFGMGYLFLVSRNMTKFGMNNQVLAIYGSVAVIALITMTIVARSLTKEKVLMCQRQ